MKKKTLTTVSEFPHLNCYSPSKGRNFLPCKPPDYPAQLFKCTGQEKKVLGWAFISSPDDSCFQPLLSAVPSQHQQNQRWNRRNDKSSSVIRKFLPLSQSHVNEHRESWGWFGSVFQLEPEAFTGKMVQKILLKPGMCRGWRWRMDGDGSCRAWMQKAPLSSPCISPPFL